MDKPLSDAQLRAERSHALIALIHELGGLAHQDQDTDELDRVLDNMLSKGIPTTPSPDLMRWIHTHRGNKQFKIAQILGVQVNKASSIIPECFGKYHDPQAVECKACLDRTLCSMKTGAKAGPVTTAYGITPANSQSILKVLQGKAGQVARTLAHGTDVILRVEANKLRLVAVTPNQNTGQALENEDNTMATKKGAPVTKSKKAAEPIEEEEVDLTLTGADDEGEEVEEVEADEEAAEEEGGEEAEEEAEEEEAAPAPKPKKEKKPKPVPTPGQKAFQDHLDGLKDSEAKQKYSAKIAKDLKLKIAEKGDARIDHMLRCMAIKKSLGEQDAAKKPTAKVKK